MRVIAGAVHLMSKGIEQPPGQGIALGVIKFNGGDAVVGLCADVAFADLSKHMIGLVQDLLCIQ